MDEKSFIHDVGGRVECDVRRAENPDFCGAPRSCATGSQPMTAKVAAQLPTSLKMLWMLSVPIARSRASMNTSSSMRSPV
jgi:hypothetical protein